MARVKLVVLLEGVLGGVRKHVFDLLFGIDPGNYDITFISSTARADAIAYPLLPLLSRRGIRLEEVAMRRGVHPLSDVRCLVAIVRILRRIRPDVLHCHGAKAGALGRIAARLADIPSVVYTPHGGAFHRFSGLQGLLYRAVERVLMAPSVHFIGVSRASCMSIRSSLRGDENRIHLVYNGIDLGEIDRYRGNAMATRADLGLPEGGFLVLYPALFLDTKGHTEFLDALEHCPAQLDSNVLIMLAGEGPLAKTVARRIRALKLETHFRFLGFQPDLYRYYGVCDLVLLPSKAEAFPYVLLEAMAFSKAIIATAVGGIPEVVTDGQTGELIPPQNLSVIVARLNHYSRHPEEAARLGKNARLAVERWFSLDSMITRTEEVYRAVMALNEAS